MYNIQHLRNVHLLRINVTVVLISCSFQAVRFAKCPAEDLPEVSIKYSISAVPTFLLLRGGSLLDRVDGANAAELTKKINLQVRF
jgi:hypothetical protein